MKTRFNYLLIAATLIGGLASCEKDDGVAPDVIDPTEVEEGKATSINISIAQPQIGTYATVDGNATDAEATLNSVDIFIYNANNNSLVTHANIPGSQFTYDDTQGKDLYIANTNVETTTGLRKIYVGVNLPSTRVAEIRNSGLLAGVKTAQTITDVSDVTTAGSGFVMFSDEFPMTVQENAASNDVTIPVKRWVAKITVHESDDLAYAISGGTISNLQFAMKNVNTKIFPAQQKDVTSTYVIDPNWADGSYVSSEFKQPTDYVAINPYNPSATINDYRAKYVPENTSEKYYEKETTYASLRAKFVPTTIKEFTNGTDDTDGYSDVSNTGTSTFYMVPGADGGVAYFIDRDVALAYATTPDDVKTYEDGYCYYNLFLNPRNKYQTIRNDYYKLTITDILGLGNPDPGPVDPEIPVAERTEVKFTVEIVPWTLISDNYQLVP